MRVWSDGCMEIREIDVRDEATRSRGHRLGLALKLATYAVIAAEHPERTTMYTWTDPDNHAMYPTNTVFGYRPVERLHEVQVKD